MHFNPPPNWPELPDDFAPTADWQPDPSWGGVPYGWSLWIDDDGEPLLAPAPLDADSGRTRNALVALVIALDGIAVVAAGQQVSLVTGLGIFYLAVAIAVGALIVAVPLKAPVSVLFITWLVVIGCIANVAWANHKLEQKRQQIEQLVG